MDPKKSTEKGPPIESETAESPQQIRRRSRGQKRAQRRRDEPDQFSEELAQAHAELETFDTARDFGDWGEDMYQSDQALIGGRRQHVGKTRKGPEGPINITLDQRRLYQLRKFIELVIAAPGPFTVKRALVLILEELERAIRQSHKEQERREILKAHGWKGQQLEDAVKED